jgi:hypothetical protein
MQNAETVLKVLRERGRLGLPCNELYRQLFNPDLYLVAYGRIYSNDGAMTPGACGETADGMSMAKIGRIIDAMRHERYRFQPVRRVYIPKKNGKKRPLGLPSWADKLVGEVIRLLLEAYYEPRFSRRSHGFRPHRGCHSALSEIEETWSGTTWFIEADISDCFGSLDHEVMLSILAEKIHDNRFLRLIKQMLQAGYLEDWEYNATLSGAPQGGVATPPTQLATSSSRWRWSTVGWKSLVGSCVKSAMMGSRFVTWFVAIVSMAPSSPGGSTPPLISLIPGFPFSPPLTRWPRGVACLSARRAGMWSRPWPLGVLKFPRRASCSPSSCPVPWPTMSASMPGRIRTRSRRWWPGPCRSSWSTGMRGSVPAGERPILGISVRVRPARGGGLVRGLRAAGTPAPCPGPGRPGRRRAAW